jgi:tetratricopeptide (TPR) repeat protein
VESAAFAAARAYEAGDCAGVVRLLGEQEPAASALDGISLYRRGFCRAALGRSGADADYAAAAERLAELIESGDAALDSHFYRVNALLNVGREDEATIAAQAAVESFRAGILDVPSTNAESWFRLGKLYRDAGDSAAALEPLGRAVTAAEQNEDGLREAYLERIVRWAGEEDDPGLADRAVKLMTRGRETTPSGLLALARADIGAGRLDSALEKFMLARRGGGEIGMAAQYAANAIQRANELKRWDLQPVLASADGTPLGALSDTELRQRIVAEAAELAPLLEAEPIEVPRKKGEGTRLMPPPEVATALRELQARLSGLLLEASRRGVPLREWAISGGYAPLVHHPLQRLYVQNARKRIDEQAAESPPQSPREP